MKNKTFWIGVAVVFVIMQLIGFVVHEVLLADAYAALGEVFRSEADMDGKLWMMMTASALTVLLFCFIFTKGYEGKGIAEGARYGLWMGLFLSIPVAVDQYVVYPLPTNVAVSWFIAGVVSMVIAGAAFAAIYKPSAN